MKFINSIIRNKEGRAKREALYQFRDMSDRMLSDCNISRELLNNGVEAWPWQATPDSFEHTRLQFLNQADVQASSNVKTPLLEDEALYVHTVAEKQIENLVTDEGLKLEQESTAQRNAA